MTKTRFSLLQGALVAPLIAPVGAIPLMFSEAGSFPDTGLEWGAMLEISIVASVISVILSYAAILVIGLPVARLLEGLGFLNAVAFCGLATLFGAVLLPSLGVLVVTPMFAQTLVGGATALVIGLLFCKVNRIGFRSA